MAITLTVYDEYVYRKDKGEVDLDTDDIKAILLASAYTVDQGAHSGYSDITNELSGVNGYTVGGELLARSGTVTKDTVNHWSVLDFSDVTWTASGGDLGGGAFQHVVFYDDTHASDILICCFNLGTTYTIQDGMNFKLQTLQFKSLQGS